MGTYLLAIDLNIELLYIGSVPDQDLTDDYPKIGESTCWNSTNEGRLIIMVAPTGATSHNSSSRYPTIGRSEASSARTPNDRMIQNLNSDFNAIRLHCIVESIQCMALEALPLSLWLGNGLRQLTTSLQNDRSATLEENLMSATD
jgi:hypothetical protein